MTKTKHNQTLEIALFIVAVFAVLMGEASVNGGALPTSQLTNYSKIYGETVISDDTTGFVCPEDISTYTDLNACSSNISSGLNVLDPEARIITLTWQMQGATNASSPASGINQINSYVFNEGTTIVNYSGSDLYNNSFNCSFTVTVTDNQLPAIRNLPKNITVSTAAGECGAEVSWPDLVIIDNCLNESQILTTYSHISGSWFEIGTTSVSCRISNGLEGEDTEYTFNVVVVDNEIPLLTSPQKVTVDCGNPVPDAFVTLQQFVVAGGVVSDNCEIDESSFSFTREIRTGSTCPFTITRTYQVEDEHGNIAEIDHHIQVQQESGLKSATADYTATQSGNWNDAATWGGFGPPTSGDNVTIPTGITVTVNSAAVCNNIDIQSGGSVVVNNSNVLQVYGDWNNAGTFNAGTDGTVEFTGTNNATISGTTTFENLIVLKGSLSSTLTISGTTSVSSGGVLTMNSGLITIPSAGSLSLDFSSGLSIPSTAGFDVTGGSLSTGNFSITNNGLIRISSGTADFGTASGNTVHTQVDGAFIVSGGTVNIAGRLENTAGGTLTPPGVNSGITVSGGTVTLATVGNGLSSIGSLNVTANGDFRFTGGTIVFQNPSTATTELDLGVVGGAGTKDVLGGTFQFGNALTPASSSFNIASDIILDNVTSSANADLVLESDVQVINLALNSATTIDLNGYALQQEVTGTGIYSYPIEDGSGNPVFVQINLTSGSGFGPGDYIEVTTSDGKHPDNESDNHFLNQYWTVNVVGITNPVFNITAEYHSLFVKAHSLQS
nr:G8 domain-containing protein [uncultured Draconibacterium sp.]